MIYFETWYNKGNESIKSYWKGGIIVNALRRHEEERVQEVCKICVLRAFDYWYPQSSSSLFGVESWTSKRWEDLSWFIASVSKHESSNCLQQYQGFNWWGVVSEIKVRNDTTTYFDFMGHDHLNVWCVKNVAVSQMWTLKYQIFAKKQRVKVVTRSPRPRWPSMAFAQTVKKW